ncbi:hypothetical protein ACFL6K_00815 [Candidatus Latescibacterota bacterium]
MNNRSYVLFSVILLTLVSLCPLGSFAENNPVSIMFANNNDSIQIPFPDIADDLTDKMTYESIISSGISPSAISAETYSVAKGFQAEQAIWPFGGEEKSSSRLKPKSTRKAFFLSLLIPGLGETYVGSKRGLIFMGAEIFAWYMYITNTNEGNDLESEYIQYAENYWHYEDKIHSDGSDLAYNYWDWLVNEYDIDETEVNFDDYLRIKEIVEEAGASHSLPTTKTQQYYEMIGKYDHFVYGWEDIIDENPILTTDGVPNGTYIDAANTGDIDSPLRLEYMEIRKQSNDKLKSGQNGINLMILNRVFSAISAGRLAYHHNKKLETDLSKIRIHFVEKYIIDQKVPMIMFTKKF